MTRYPSEIYTYIGDLTRFHDPILKEMEDRARETNFPIIGPVVGPWLYQLARMINAKRIFEMGSGYGYSTWFFAKALDDNGGGEVVHTVWDEKLSEEAKVWLEKAGMLRCLDFQVSESTLALESAEPGIDLIFMDIDKEGYRMALDTIERRLRPGGLLLIDNTLIGDRVVKEDDQREDVVSVREMNKYLGESPRWDYLINPLRDGLGIALFKG